MVTLAVIRTANLRGGESACGLEKVAVTRRRTQGDEKERYGITCDVSGSSFLIDTKVAKRKKKTVDAEENMLPAQYHRSVHGE